MPRNVEIKAKVRDIETLKCMAKKLSGSDGTLIEQEDTFFNAPNGRLKLRELKNAPAQLVFYARADSEGPKLSNFHITETDKPQQLKETLSLAMGVKGVVNKCRWLYLVGQTRIHVDDVKGLGHFMELEVMLDDTQTVEDGQVIAEDLRQKLQVEKSDLITCAYMDLILKNSEVSNGH